MPVNYTRDDYDYQLPIWEKCRHVVEGQERMHIEGETYLPKLSGQNNKEYLAYVERALFYNATQRTVDAMTGLLFRKEPMITIPKAIENWVDNIDMNGNSLRSFAEDIADEILTVGRLGLLVEHPEVIIEEDQESYITQAQAEEQNLRPFLAKYLAENIINWKVTVINNQKILTMVVLREYHEDNKDEFECDYEVRYRVLDLDPETGNYRQRVFVASDKNENQFLMLSEVYPLQNGKNLKSIPFIIINSKGVQCEITKSPILDLVNVNISHYKTTADLEHGAHFTGLPTAVVTGHTIKEGSSPLKIGASTAWVFSEPDANAKFLEFTGSGLSSLEKRLERKENQMATLGARMLASEKASTETAETHIIKRQGENSALSSIAAAIDDAITKALKIMSEWVGVDGDIDYKINKDFIPTKMEAAHLLALFQIYQGGGIGFSDFIENLQRGEIIDSDKTVDEVRNEIDTSGPIGGNFDLPEEVVV